MICVQLATAKSAHLTPAFRTGLWEVLAYQAIHVFIQSALPEMASLDEKEIRAGFP